MRAKLTHGCLLLSTKTYLEKVMQSVLGSLLVIHFSKFSSPPGTFFNCFMIRLTAFSCHLSSPFVLFESFWLGVEDSGFCTNPSSFFIKLVLPPVRKLSDMVLGASNTSSRDVTVSYGLVEAENKG